ncbi:unnamed protein product [Closterium sp. NIES-54]
MGMRKQRAQKLRAKRIGSGRRRKTQKEKRIRVRRTHHPPHLLPHALRHSTARGSYLPPPSSPSTASSPLTSASPPLPPSLQSSPHALPSCVLILPVTCCHVSTSSSRMAYPVPTCQPSP